MKIHLILVAMLFILIAGFAFDANLVMADKINVIEPPTVQGIYLRTTVGVSPPPQAIILGIHSSVVSGTISPYPKNRLSTDTTSFKPGDKAISLSVNTADLEVGLYCYGVDLIANGLDGTNERKTVFVTVRVENQPFVYGTYFKYLALDGASNLDFTVVDSANSSKPIQMVAPSGSSINWNATTNENWVSLSQFSGTTPSTVQVSINAAGFNPGNYTANITFKYPNTSYPDNEVKVNLTVKRNNLGSGKTLTLGQNLLSENGQFKLAMQVDGNLVLYRTSDNFAMWASGTNGQAANLCKMQEDGNLVIYNQGGQPLWASVTDGNVGAYLQLQDDGKVFIYKSTTNPTPIWSTAVLCSGRTLQSGRILRSGNGQYKLEMQTDGNLVLRFLTYLGEPIVWASNTYGNPGSRVEMQLDGNLVIRTPSNQIIWASNTYTTSNASNNGSLLKVQDDGKLVIYRSNNSTAIWNDSEGRLY